MTPMAAAGASHVEYLIYTFDFPSGNRRARSPWHRYAALADEELALAQAQILSDTQKYRRIEVKKKYVDARTGRPVDATLRVYENGLERSYANLIGFAVGVTAMLGCALLLVLLF